MSSSPSPGYYDVFLSFRGEDTRKTIASHLYRALVTRGISTFKDDPRIELGGSIPEELRRAIKSSKFAIVVISKSYATSRWCLDELLLIMKLTLEEKIGVIPVFYEVYPSDVKNLRETFDLIGHRRCTTADKISMWIMALRLIGNRKGTESSKYKDDATMVEEIVRLLSSRLFSMLPMAPGNIVGLEAHLEQINRLLDMDTHTKNDKVRNPPLDKDTNTKKDKVRMIGIWGMGGIGKTAIAKHLYEQHKKNFSTHHSFIDNVSSAQHGLVYLQKQLLSNILGEEDLKFRTVDQGASYIHSRLRNLKALIVLDDVDDVKQLNALAKEVGWFGPGSLIIITTRDKRLLSTSGVKKNKYKVKYLDEDEALQLFQRIAFQGRKPPSRVYQDLANRVSRLAQGLPLALETFGFYLHDKSLVEWQDALKMFEEAPYEDIMTVLKLSYDKLDKIGKTAFLHVACLFNGDPFLRVMTLLERGRAGINALVEKSLIDISSDGRIVMHRLLEQTGRQIVRQESGNNLAEQRILWHHDDIYRVLEDNAGTSRTEAIALDVSVESNDFHIKWDVFKPMHNLSFLKIYGHSRGLESRREDVVRQKKLSVPHKLRFLHWDAYPFTTLSTSISPDCLVELNLCYSKLRTLWSGTPRLLHLRKLDLTGSKDLKELPDLQEAVCLEELILEGCTSLKRIPKSICGLSTLQKIDVSNCDGLKKLRIKITESKSTGFQDTSLSVRSVYLKFFGTEPFVAESQGIPLEHPSVKGNLKIELKHLKGNAEHLSFISKKQVSRKLMMLELESPPYCFKSLDIMRFNFNKKSSHFKCISFAGFPWLIELNLINLHIQVIPEDIQQMQVLEKLDLSGNFFKGLPETMNLLTKLKHLTLCNCRSLEKLPELSQLETLALSDCTSLRTLVKLEGRYSLLKLWLDNCKNVESLSDELRHLTKLTYLDLSRHDFETLPTSIMGLSSLVTLCLGYCSNLESLTGLPPSLKRLKAHGCKSLKTSSLPRIQSIDLSHCPHWKQNSSQITRFPAGRRSREVRLCACFQETSILTRDYQVSLSILLQRLKPWLWAFASFILIVGLAILLVGIAILLTSGIDPFRTLLLSVQVYLNTLVMIIFLYQYCKKLTFPKEV